MTKIKSKIAYWSIYLTIFLSLYLIFSAKSTTRITIELGHLFLYSAGFYFSLQTANFLWRNLIKVNLFNKLFVDKINPEDKSVLITGCDSGFGNSLARKLDKYGFKVFACCLFPEKEGAQNLIKDCSANLEVIRLDVTNVEDVESVRLQVEESLEKSGKQLFGLVNNAGILISSEIEFGSITNFTKQMDVNCIGMVAVTKAFLPLLRKSSGRILNMASLAGRFSIPGMVGYCMSKSGVISFSEGLRREVKKWGIEVITVEPHLFKTNLCDDKLQQMSLLKSWEETPAEVKVDYGKEYFDNYKKFIDKVMGSARPRVNDVVETMFNGLTHVFVGPNYRVMSEFDRVRVWMWEFWPIRGLDWVCNWVTLLTTGKPAALIKATYEKRKNL